MFNPDSLDLSSLPFLLLTQRKELPRIPVIYFAQDDPQFTQVKVNAHSSKAASPDKVRQAWEQEKRRPWRELVAIIKAKLIAAESAVEVFEIPLAVSVEREFMANIVVPETGQTVGEWLQPQLADAYAIGRAIALLPGGK